MAQLLSCPTLSGTILIGAILSGTILSGVTLSGVTLSAAILNDVTRDTILSVALNGAIASCIALNEQPLVVLF